MILLVVLMLCAEAGRGAVTGTADPEPPSVPVPTSVLITSYNFNPVLCWKYENMSQTPIFTVQVKNYRSGWIDSCTNISDHCCNICEQILRPDESVWARVKAKVGQKESVYAESKEFIMCRQGKVGPPGLDVRKEEDKLIVHVFHPEVIKNRESCGVKFENDCHTFDYTVDVKSDRNGEILHTKLTITEENCDEDLCQLSIPLSTLDSQYCISVDGFSEFWQVKTEQSKDICVLRFRNNRKDPVWIMIVVPVSLFIICILAVTCWYIKKNPSKRKSIMLPKSLLSVVRNVTSETKPESPYTSLVTSCQAVVLEGETVICEDQLSQVTAPDTPGEAEHEESSKEAEAGTAEGSISPVTPDSPPTPAPIQRSGSFQSSSCSITTCHSRNGSDSGVVGSGSSLSDSGFLPHNNTETKIAGQDPMPVRKAPTSFGYDKPHVLVDVPVDGGKESLIGYRLTADAQELSQGCQSI
ncbi:interferon gamma receptor 1 [Acomys russatus]|uniref:interferon gamma receptor 1 n=1 Tax=Acomys russatus TaxID=60746 RepID=UPI0021E24B60|nr:interferon gamma receptor 1 [Acomys russatus]